jgi:hypothetical protein
MPAKKLGVPVTPKSSMPNDDEKKFTRTGWRLSERTRLAIEDIEANVRTAVEKIGSLTLK